MLQAFVEAFDGSEDSDIWQFKDVRFDIQPNFQYLPWQKVSSICQGVEDAKGNPGQTGVIMVSSIRIIWYLTSSKDTNLSLGYDCITRTDKKVMFLQNGAAKYILTLKALRGNARYEFQFCSVNQNIQAIFDQIIKLHRCAFQTTVYRKITLKATLSNKVGQLVILSQEEIKSKYTNVKCFIQGQLQLIGTLYITNIRIAWISKDPQGNFSLPWICVCRLNIVQTNDMDTLCVEAKDKFGIMKFIIYCKQLRQVHIEASRLHQTYRLKPILGFDFSQLSTTENKVQEFQEDVEFQQAQINIVRKRRTNTNYMTGDQTTKTNIFQQIVFSEQLGLAIEPLPEGVDVAQLWEILKG